MLVERDTELELVANCLRRARDGHGSALLLCGEPGIGKSALLLHAIERASGPVLRARGVELEAQMPFVALRDLLAPLHPDIDRLPPLQRRALHGALAIEEDGAVEPFALSVGVLTLLTERGGRDPLTVVVDDLHWVDAASLATLQFVARRIEHEALAILLATRVAPEGFDPGSCTVCRVRALTAEGVRAMVAEADAAVDADAIIRTTGGNPLAVAELLRDGGVALHAGAEPLRPLEVNDVIRSAFRGRVARLSPPARTVVLAAAASAQADPALLVRAATRLGSGLAAFEEAEAADVIELAPGRLSFRHPIMRSVVYSESSAQDRRAVHHALAEEAAASGQADEQAWHLALAAVLPDEDVAGRLEVAAAGYERRSGHVAAAHALVRAADLTPDDNTRARRLHDAAESARRGGRGAWAGELLDKAALTARSVRLRADIDFTRAILLAWTEPATGSSCRFEHLAERTVASEPEVATLAYGYAAASAVVEGNIPEARRCASLAAATAEGGNVSTEAHEVAMQAEGISLLLVGDQRGAVILRAAAREMLARGERTGREYIALPLIWLEEHELVQALLAPRLQDVRERGDLRALTASLDVQAILLYRIGDWVGAQGAAAESVRLAEESDQTVQLAYSASTLAIVEAAQGRDGAYDRARDAAQLGARLGLEELAQYVDSALGLLELGRGEPAAALGPLIRAAGYVDAAGQREPCVHQWPADLIDAAVLTKQVGLADRTIRRVSAATERPWAQAVAWRGRGMLAPTEEYEAAFTTALDWHERTEAPFERGRTELWWGRRLRRDRRRVDARAHLGRALELFEALGARPWAEATRRELTASGERLRRDEDARDELTPQETQIVALVVDGASNRDIAGTMYLSPKTVEAHLSRIYRKFDVRSRQQLAARMRRDAAIAASGRP